MDTENKNEYPDALNDVLRTFGPKDPRPCRKCGETWTPSGWNFYDLCDNCFSTFNAQKMAGRMSGSNDYYESASNWIDSSKDNDSGTGKP